MARPPHVGDQVVTLQRARTHYRRDRVAREVSAQRSPETG